MCKSKPHIQDVSTRKRAVKTRLQVIHLPNAAFHHHIICTESKNPFVPKDKDPHRENVEIWERGWRQELFRGNIFLLSLSSVYGGQGKFGLQILGRKVTVTGTTWEKTNSLVDLSYVIFPLCKIDCSILRAICAEQRWWGGKERENEERWESCAAWRESLSSIGIREAVGQQGKWMAL